MTMKAPNRSMNRSLVRRLRAFDLEHVRHTRSRQEWIPHWHTEWSFGAVVRGQCRCSVGGQAMHAREGDLIAIAPGVVHTGVLDAALSPQDAPDDVLVVMLYVPASFLGHEGLPQPARSGNAHAPALAAQAAGLQSVAEVQAWLQAAVPVLSAALAAGEPAAGHGAPSPAERALLERLRAAVLAGEHRVDAVARRCGVGRKRLHQVLSQWVGMAPSDYLRTARLHRARDLLARHEPLAAVADACGFADQAHFTRWFRRAFGYTPGDWVQALGRG
jgi:AraC-like DNA-binding protein